MLRDDLTPPEASDDEVSAFMAAKTDFVVAHYAAWRISRELGDPLADFAGPLVAPLDPFTSQGIWGAEMEEMAVRVVMADNPGNSLSQMCPIVAADIRESIEAVYADLGPDSIERVSPSVLICAARVRDGVVRDISTSQDLDESRLTGSQRLHDMFRDDQWGRGEGNTIHILATWQHSVRSTAGNSPE